MKKTIVDKTLIRFLFVGIINTGVGAGVMFVLYNIAHCTYWVSSAANYLVGGIISFFLNKYFTFQSMDWSWKQVGRFAFSVMICYVLAYGMAKPIVLILLHAYPERVQENIAMLVGMFLYTGLNYLSQRFFAFKSS